MNGGFYEEIESNHPHKKGNQNNIIGSKLAERLFRQGLNYSRFLAIVSTDNFKRKINTG